MNIRAISCGLLLAATLGVLPRAVEAQRFKWWQDDAVQKKVGLNRDQINRLEDIFSGSLPDLKRTKQELDRLERELLPLADSASDDAALRQHVDRVEGARAEMNKNRSLMLFRMRRVLTPDQRIKLEVLQYDRDHRDHKKPDSRH